MGQRPLLFVKHPLLYGLGALFLCAAAAVAGGSCDPTTFDDQAAKAPVRIVGTPENLSHFESVAAPLTHGKGDDNRADTVVVGGSGSAALFAVQLGEAGKLTTHSGGDPEDRVSDMPRITSIAQLENADNDPLLLVGVPDDKVIYQARINDDGFPVREGDSVHSNSFFLDVENFGGQVAGGYIGEDGEPNKHSWVVTTDSSIFIIPLPFENSHGINCEEAFLCDSSCDAFHAEHRALSLGRLMDNRDHSDSPRQTIAVGIPRPDDDVGNTRSLARLIFYNRENVSMDDPPRTCDASGGFENIVLTPLGRSEHFGSALLTVNLDGDDNGWDELLIGDPGAQRVFVLHVPTDAHDATGWRNAVTVDELAPTDPVGVVAFGAALTAVDLDGDGRREIAVGDPEATVEGEAQAGRVHLFSVSFEGGHYEFEELGTLTDHEPGKTLRVGKALAPIVAGDVYWEQSNPIAEDLLVVADGRVYVFLETGAFD
jgi:hypothetical protein